MQIAISPTEIKKTLKQTILEQSIQKKDHQESICLCLDRSSSMSESLDDGTVKINALIHAVSEFFAKTNVNMTALNIIFFNHSFIQIDGSFSEFFNQLFTIYPNGGTVLSPALDACIEVLRTFKQSSAIRKRIILVSDGVASDPEKALGSVGTCARLDIVIDTIGVGSLNNTDLTFLEAVSKATGGKFQHIRTLEQFESSFKRLETRERWQLTE